MSGLQLEEPDEDDKTSCSIDLAPGNYVVKRFVKSSGGGGGKGAMGGMANMYDFASEEFSIVSTKAELYEEEA